MDWERLNRPRFRRPSEIRADYEERQREKARAQVDLELALLRARRAGLRTCAACQHWVIAGGDTHCGGCGAPAVDTRAADEDHPTRRGRLETVLHPGAHILDVR